MKLGFSSAYTYACPELNFKNTFCVYVYLHTYTLNVLVHFPVQPS